MIKLDGICKKYGDKTVLDGVSLSVEKGGRLGIMGRSGVGKTTLIRILLGLEAPDSGTRRVEGTLSAVFQEDRLFEGMSVYKNLRAVCDSDEVIASVLQGVCLSSESGQTVDKLSGGMARRVAIARALAFCHDILILDEPFRGLDDNTKLAVCRFINEWESGKTLIVITHDQSELELLQIEDTKVL